MKVSAKAEYACLALIDLAHRQANNRPVNLREIAQAQCIPQSTLTQVMLKLKREGLVRSTRGSEGGYRLARPPEEIKLGQILKVIDGDESASREMPGACAKVLATVWDQIRELESGVLARTSIAQLVGRVAPFDWTI